MHKMILKAARGDEKFLMKDINCELEYDMLKKYRVRAEIERKQEAATRIQRWFKTVRQQGFFKLIVRL